MKSRMKAFFSLSLFLITLSAFASHPTHNPPFQKYKFSKYKHAKYQKYSEPCCMLPPCGSPCRRFELIGAAGMAKLDGGNSSVGVTRSETDRLVQTNRNSFDTPAYQFGVGYKYPLCGISMCSNRIQWLSSVEPQINLYHLASDSIKGDVLRYGSSSFNDLTFDAPIHSTRLMLDAALTVATWREFSFYAKGGIGAAWNSMSYNEKVRDSSSCPPAPLRLNSGSTSNFAWELGAGLLLTLNERIGISFEYLYADLGRMRASSSGNTGNITTPVIVTPQFHVSAQTGLLGLHLAV